MKAVTLLLLSLLMLGAEAWAACEVTIKASTPTKSLASPLGLFDNGDGTVTHVKTGLMWKQCPEGASGGVCGVGVAALYTWGAALQQAVILNNAGGFAGFSDWRLPNRKELNSIVEEQCRQPAINVAIFPATTATYWSASPDAAAAANAWLVNFDDGSERAFSKNVAVGYARLVRGGF